MAKTIRDHWGVPLPAAKVMEYDIVEALTVVTFAIIFVVTLMPRSGRVRAAVSRTSVSR
jgi:hypothetical protein